MIIYKIEGNGVTRFAGAQAKASAKVTELVKENGGKRGDYKVTEVDFDTKKEPLLSSLNALCMSKEEAKGGRL